MCDALGRRQHADRPPGWKESGAKTVSPTATSSFLSNHDCFPTANAGFRVATAPCKNACYFRWVQIRANPSVPAAIAHPAHSLQCKIKASSGDAKLSYFHTKADPLCSLLRHFGASGLQRLVAKPLPTQTKRNLPQRSSLSPTGYGRGARGGPLPTGSHSAGHPGASGSRISSKKASAARMHLSEGLYRALAADVFAIAFLSSRKSARPRSPGRRGSASGSP
mmetsp:Transcript_14037/g.52585  ORF Transcript_14037/g.52585 Transcript_14037/m.52585 type:complete len:222 (+) Transcript_14037:1209-1874(+)